MGMIDRDGMMAIQDDCLVALSTSPCRRPDMRMVRSLPPWRAVMIARIAFYCGVVTSEELETLTSDAKRVGGNGILPVHL